ncbi:hypothetical protein HII31_04063 [Pseudocercospora fuligena]|uniref:Uncharacterized protein n=1 Tax=Pseudocercospora fuligena TaxID=685502 RepID=A0A8H6RPQ6_9PEZI|nr:hypothetical protein HII31_04063 [Pseudocercospora fuligena]
MSRPFRPEASMRTRSTCLQNLMAEKDREHAKRVAEEKEAEAQRAEEARHLGTPGSWIDEDTVTPKQPFYYFPDTPDAPEKNDAAGRKALNKETVAKEAERVKRQQSSAVITPTRKPGLSMAATGVPKNSIPPKKSGIRVNPDGQRDAIKEASALADQRTGKATSTPEVLGKHLDCSRIAKSSAARRMTVRETEHAFQAKLEVAEAEYMEGRRRFEVASGGMPLNMMWESDAKFHFLEDQEYYGPLLKKIEEWKGVRDWYSAKLAALRAKYSKPAPRIQPPRKKEAPSIRKPRSIAVDKPAHIKSTRERFEAYRAFDSANPQHELKKAVVNAKGYITVEQARELSEALRAHRKATPHQGLLVAPDLFDHPELEDHPAPRYAPVSNESKHDNQSMLTSSYVVEGAASQHALPLEQSHAKASRYVEPAPMEPVQEEEHASQETEQTTLTPSTEADGTVSHHAFNLEQPYAQVAHNVEPASSEPLQVKNKLPRYEQPTLTASGQLEDTVSQHALHLKQLHAQATKYIKPVPSEPVPAGEEALPRHDQSGVASPEPAIHALDDHKKSIVTAAMPSQPLPHKGERRWSNHNCNMDHCRAYFSFAKDYSDRGVFNGRPSVLGKRSIDDVLSNEEQDLETRRVRKKCNIFFGQEIVHVLAEGFHGPIKVRAPKDQRARGVEYLTVPSTPFESQISAVNGVRDRGEPEYRKAMDLYEGGFYFGAEGLQGKDDDLTNSGEAMVINEDEGIEEGEEVHGYVERFLSDPTSHNGVYFIYRHSGLGDMIKIDVPRDIWLRQDDHNEDNLDRAQIYVLIQLCEIVRLDNKLLSAMDPNVAGQLANSNLGMLIRAFNKFANSCSWLDRWTTRRQVRGLLDQLIKLSAAFDRDDGQIMQHFVDDSDGPIAHVLKALRAILAGTENDRNHLVDNSDGSIAHALKALRAILPEPENDKDLPTPGEAPRRTFTPEQLEEGLDAILQEAGPPTHPQTLHDEEEDTLENTMSNAGGARGPPAIAAMGPREGRREGRD